MTDPERELEEAALTPEEVERILRICGPQALLVGGQALAIWAAYYHVQPVGELSRSITTDADFIGTSSVAEALQRSLGPPWKLRKASGDDVGEQVAKVYAKIPRNGIKQVDFLSGIIGLKTDDVVARVTQVELADGVTIRLLHPLDVLESRLRNLDVLSSKQNSKGMAQARLAVDIVRAFIEDCMDQRRDPKIVRQAIKRVQKIALDTRLARVAFKYHIDVPGAIPTARVAQPLFHQKQWPKVLDQLDRKRKKFVTAQSRQSNAATRSRRKEKLRLTDD